jgi:yersiniabactin nonribosomal peptide synthetase
MSLASNLDKGGPLLSIEVVRGCVVELLGPDCEVQDDDDLFDAGLDSVRLMHLAARFSRNGIDIKFAELAESPSVAGFWKLLAARGERQQAIASECPSESALTHTAPFDLTPVQHAYWIGRRRDQVLGGVGCHAYLEFDHHEPLDAARLELAARRLEERHGMLRAVFTEDGQQQIFEHGAWRGLVIHDLTTFLPDVAQRQLEDVRHALSHRLLAVEQGEVFDFQLSLLPDGRSRLHFNIDLLVCDVLSMQILLRDLAQLYVHPDTPLPAIRYSFHSYLSDERTRRSGIRETSRAYWRVRLPELPSGPQLPLAKEPSKVGRPHFTRRVARLSAAQWKALGTAARAHGVTPAMALATAFAEVLAAWSSQQRFLLNLPLFDRQPLHPDVPELVADFTSLLLLDVDVSDDRTFVEHALRVQKQFRTDVDHASYSGIEVLRDLGHARADDAPSAPVVFACNLGSELVDDDFRRSLGTFGWMLSQTPQVWLDHQVYESDGGLLLAWDSVDGLFAPGVVDDMLASYERLLQWLAIEAANWALPLPSLIPERQLALRRQINLQGAAGRDRTLHVAFFDWASRDPSRAALFVEGAPVSYGHIADRALHVAGWLAEQGIVPGDCVGVALPKGAEQVIAVLGILAAGCAYVPVGTQQPPNRRARMLASAGARVVLENLDCASQSPPLHRPVEVQAQAIAYIIFTSGSTGEPKGVEVTHAAAANTIDDINERFRIGANDRALAVSALDFDLSVYDIFGLLSVGGALVIVSDASRRDAYRWKELAHRHGITMWNSVPTLFEMFLAAVEDESTTSEGDEHRVTGIPASLRVVLLSGDWVGLDLPGRLAALAPSCRFVALGGATEAAIWSNAFEVSRPLAPDWRSIPYGFPLRSQAYRVVDTRGRDCPDWTPGELWIGGKGVAAGYCGDPSKTAEKFVTDNGCRWYRTGDLGRYWADGTLEFLGRLDHQVKVRGHRIELGEVESALLAAPDVGSAVVVAVGDRNRRRLVAAVTEAPGKRLATGDLRDWLRQKLPDYMVPEHFELLDRLPLTANGKVDRGALTSLLNIEPARVAQLEEPQTPAEKAIANVWQQVLGTSQIGRDDSFFALGGDSLSATRVVARLRADGMVGVDLASLFATPHLRELAAMVAVAAEPRAHVAITPDLPERYKPFPLTEVQRAYRLGQQRGLPLSGVSAHYYSEFDGVDVDLPRLERAWNQLVRRHDMLRAVIEDDEQQRILPHAPTYAISSITVPESASDSEVAAALASMRDSMSHQVLDVSQWPVFDIRAVRYAGTRTRIGISLDNSLIDALSMMIVFVELDRLYRDPHAVLPPPTLSFRDYVVQVAPEANDVIRAQEYWRGRLATLPPAPQLPLSKDPAAIVAPRFVRREGALSAAQWQKLKDKAQRAGVTPATVLLACYAEILSYWSGRQDLTVTVTLFDRREVHPEVGTVLGDFTSLMLAAYRGDCAATWLESLRRLQEQQWRDLDHRAAGGLWVLRELARVSKAPTAAVPVVFTSALGLSKDVSLDLSVEFPQRVWGLTQTPQVWLDNKVYEAKGGLAFDWDAVDELFPAGMLDAAFDAYRRLLSWVVDADWSTPAPELLPHAQLEVRRRVNDTAADSPTHTLTSEFFHIAATEPERPALVAGEQTVSYGALAYRALQLSALLRERGVGVGDAVAITLPKGVGQIVATLGALAAGATYVPVGVDQPLARRERIYALAGVKIGITAGEAGSGAVSSLRLLDLCEADAIAPLDRPVAVSVDTVAYVIFTSGSTGEPKGVEITHRAAMNTVDDINSRFSVGQNDRVLAVSALDFDLSVYDVFGLLSVGGSMVLVPEDARRDAYHWLELVCRHRVTIWNSVPMLMDMLLVATEGTHLPECFRLAMLSGDWIGLDLPARLAAARPGCRLVGLGGATEASIWSNAFEVQAVETHWRSIPYGFPLRNQCFRVADSQGRDCPDWVAGELWIGGMGVAAGYRGDSEKTAAKFVQRDGQRWYRTGDLGRYWPDGTLEFLGRLDHQVKIRGYRIELGEIEHALQTHPDVQNAAVVTTGERAQRKLVGFVVARDGVALTPVALVEFIAGRLPAHYIPSILRFAENLPLSPNGKVDRRALEALASADEGSAEEQQAPTGAVEAAVASLWRELLGVAVVSRSDDFFALGGDSLVASRFIARLRAEGIAGAELAKLFEQPTLRDFAAGLTLPLADDQHGARPSRQLVPDTANRFEPFPLTEVQQAYWVGRRAEMPLGGVGAHFYCEFDDAFTDLPRLTDAWNQLVARHDMLRAVFDDSGTQRVLAEVPRFDISVVDLPESATQAQLDAALADLRQSLSHHVLDVCNWPVFDVRAVRYGAGRMRVAVSLDNLTLDGFSMMRLFDELARLYRDPNALSPPPNISFRDFVTQSCTQPAGLEAAQTYWRERDLPPAPQLALALEPDSLGVPRFSRRELRVAASEWDAIKATARRHGITPSVALLAAYAEVLGAWSGRRDLTLTLTLFDRREAHPDIDQVLGDFTSILLVAYEPQVGERWLDSARRLQAQLWRDLDNRDAPGIWVLRERARAGAQASFPVVFTSVIGLAREVCDALPWPDWSISQTPQVWLDHQVIERDGGAILTWDAIEALFPHGALDESFSSYARLLEWLANGSWEEPLPTLASSAMPGRRVAAPLPRAAPSRAEQDAEPSGLVELSLAAIWSDLLGFPVTGREQNFFTLGGDSLLATRLAQTVQREFGVELSLREFFTTPTIAAIGAAITRRAGRTQSGFVARAQHQTDTELMEDGTL